jgi:hypothetical protein
MRERKPYWQEVGQDLVSVGLAEEGEGEDAKVEDEAEAVEYAQVGDEAGEAAIETKICFPEDTDSDNISLGKQWLDIPKTCYKTI